MMKRRWNTALIMSLFFLFCLLAVPHPRIFAEESGALFSLRTEPQSVYPGESFQLIIRAHDRDLESPVAGFRFSVSYDPGQLTLQNISHSKQIRSGTLQTYEREDEIRGTYVCEGIAPTLLSGDCIFLTFAVSPEIPPGSVELEAKIFDLAAWNEQSLPQEYSGIFSVAVDALPSDRAQLTELSPSAGSLEPAFSPDIHTYSVTVPPEVDRMEFSTQAVENGTVAVSRKTLGAKGSTTEITITVTSESGDGKDEYTVLVYREEEPESNFPAYLEYLSPSSGTLDPAFSPDTYSYEMTVGSEVSRIDFSMQAAEGGTASVNRKTLLSAGNITEFTITVSSQDKQNKAEYTVFVYREKEQTEGNEKSSLAELERLIPVQGELFPAFDPEILDYTMEVPFEITQMQFHTRAAEDGTVSVDRKNLGSGGSLTIFTITVTSEDKSEKQFYTVTVHRLEETPEDKGSATAKLSALIPSDGSLDPAFSPDIYEYTLSVPSEISSVTFSAEAQENGSVRVSRKTLGKMGSTTDITVTVTSESGEEKGTYLIAVHRGEPEQEPESDESTSEPPKNENKQTSSSAKEEPAETAGMQDSSGASDGREEYSPDPPTEDLSNQPEETILQTESVSASTGSGVPLVIEQNQFPAFLTGFLVAIILLLLGIIAGMLLVILLYLRRKPPKE